MKNLTDLRKTVKTGMDPRRRNAKPSISILDDLTEK